MKRLLSLLAGLIFAGLDLPALCVTTTMKDEDTVKAVAQKDYQAALTKIQADDKAAVDNCAKYQGPAANACMIQAHGKRERAESDAKAIVDRAGRTPPLPDASAKAAAKAEMAKAKDDRKAANRNIAEERKAAIAECSKLKGTEHTGCIKDVDARRAEAVNLANAIYQKSVHNAKALTPP
jgi:hypothetical protein